MDEAQGTEAAALLRVPQDVRAAVVSSEDPEDLLEGMPERAARTAGVRAVRIGPRGYAARGA